MENFVKYDLNFEDVNLSSLINNLNKDFDRNQKSFIYICKDIYTIWSYCKGNYWKANDNEYYNSYKLLEKFGFDKKAVSRYKNCYEKFIIDSNNEFDLIVSFKEFSPSKLFELLVISRETAISLIDKKVIVPNMTVKQIRDVVKSLKEGTDKVGQVVENVDLIINEEDIPMAYDPKKEYDYSYFESKSKAQLLNMIWDLQKLYQDLKKKKG